GKPFNKVQRISLAGRRHYFFTRGPRFTERYILVNRAPKQHDLLRHNTYVFAVHRQIIRFHRLSIYSDGAFCRTVETKEQADQRRFSCSARSDKRDRFARMNGEAHPVGNHNARAGRVDERYIVKFNLSEKTDLLLLPSVAAPLIVFPQEFEQPSRCTNGPL